MEEEGREQILLCFPQLNIRTRYILIQTLRPDIYKCWRVCEVTGTLLTGHPTCTLSAQDKHHLASLAHTKPESCVVGICNFFYYLSCVFQSKSIKSCCQAFLVQTFYHSVYFAGLVSSTKNSAKTTIALRWLCFLD